MNISDYIILLKYESVSVKAGGYQIVNASAFTGTIAAANPSSGAASTGWTVDIEE